MPGNWPASPTHLLRPGRPRCVSPLPIFRGQNHPRTPSGGGAPPPEGPAPPMGQCPSGTDTRLVTAQGSQVYTRTWEAADT